MCCPTSRGTVQSAGSARRAWATAGGPPVEAGEAAVGEVAPEADMEAGPVVRPPRRGPGPVGGQRRGDRGDGGGPAGRGGDGHDPQPLAAPAALVGGGPPVPRGIGVAVGWGGAGRGGRGAVARPGGGGPGPPHPRPGPHPRPHVAGPPGAGPPAPPRGVVPPAGGGRPP